MKSPTPQFDESLLSAYVDGELSADERAMVERHLAQHAEARQLVAELQQVSQLVQSLPRSDVPAGFADRVTLAIDARNGGGGDAIPIANVRQPLGQRVTRWQWAAAALAASLLVVALWPREPDTRDVAHTAGDANPGELRVESRLENAVPAGTDFAADVAPRETPTPDLAPIAADRTAGLFEPQPAAPVPMSVPSGDVPSGDVAGGVRGGGRSSTAAPAIPGDNDESPGFGGGGMRGGGARSLEGVADNGATIESDSEQPGDIPLVVQIETSLVSFERKDLDKLFVNNGIVVKDQPLLAGENQSIDAAATDLPVERSTADGAAQRAARSGTLAGAADSQPRSASAWYARAGIDGGDVDEAILVEASPAQFVQCLDDMSRQMSNFRRVAIDASQVAEPVRQQLAPMQQQFVEEAELKNWVANNRAVIVGEMGRQANKAGDLAAKSTNQPAAAAIRMQQSAAAPASASAEPLAADAATGANQFEPSNLGCAQVLYSNNPNRAYWSQQRADGDADGPPVDALQNVRSLVELSELAARSRDNAAGGVPSMRVLFLLKAAPPDVAAEAAPADEP